MDKELDLFLKDLKQYGIGHNIPNISEEAGKFLSMLIKIHGSKNILEIGSANGYSTIYLAEAAKYTGGKVTSIDFSKPNFDMAVSNIKKVKLAAYVNHVFGDALTVIPDLKESFDFVFIDGEKTSYCKFLKLVEGCIVGAKNLVSPSEQHSVICIDNVKRFPEKTREFWDYVKHQNRFEYCAVSFDEKDEMMVMR